MKKAVAVLAAGFALLASPVHAAVTFQYLFDGGSPISVSNDGSVVVGNDDNFTSFRWTQATGFVSLGRPQTGGGGGVPGVSADGTRVGYSIGSLDGTYRTQGRWTLGSGWQELMPPAPADGGIVDGSYGSAWDISGDGNTVVGLYWRSGVGNRAHASKWTQATEYLNAADPQPTKMISDLDVTNRLSLNGIYELPFGNGKRFASEASGITEALVGGWQVQGVYTWQTGFPISFGTDAFYNGGDIALPSGDQTIQKWFNTAVFTSLLTDPVANNSTPVNHLRTLPTRFSDVRRDSINNLDLSAIKNVRLHGSRTLQLRFEFINVLDEPYFPAPIVSPTTNTFGQVTASNQSNYARRAQLGVKFTV